jgi:biotin synthase-related radical SAM superfamily protein
MDFTLIISLIAVVITGTLILIATYLVLKIMSKNLEKTLRSEIIRQNNQDFAKLKMAAYERLALLLERNSIPSLIHKFTHSAGTPIQISEMMQRAVMEEFNYNLSQQVYVSQQTWTTLKIVKEQTLIFIKKTERSMPPNATKADFLGSLITQLQENGEIPHEKGLQMIRTEMEILFQ